MAKKSFRFDKQYYDRYYRRPTTRVTSPQGMRRLGAFVCDYLKLVGQPVRNVLDLGCGLGTWKRIIRRHFPRAVYHGVEYSEYLCKQYGWIQGSIVDYVPPEGEVFDLVICQGVMQYLETEPAAKAIANLGQLCRGAMYLEALTIEDWREVCDQKRTDGNVHLRKAEWYRTRLRRDFQNIGGGVFLAKTSPAVMFELERAE